MSWDANKKHGNVRGRWKALVYFYNLNGGSFCFWSREKEHSTWPQQKGLDVLKNLVGTYKGKYSGIAIYDCEHDKRGHQILYYDKDGVCNYKQGR